LTTKTEAASQVRKVLQQVKDQIAKPGGIKVNEATTRAHFINPLLDALGYSSIDDVAFEYYLPDGKQFLDYRLSIRGQFRLAVEAKALDVSLTDSHGAQVVQYCSVLGDEWAVVTNARQWRLYHTFVQGPLAEKLVQSIDLVAWNSDQQFDSVFEQLWLVSREAFETSDGPSSWLVKQRIDKALTQALTDPGSPEAKYLRKRLQDQGIATSAEEVALWFKARLEGSQRAPKPSPPQVQATVAPTKPTPASTKPNPTPLGGVRYWLLPAGARDGLPAEDYLKMWLPRGYWGFGAGTPGRKAIKAGDHVCFYTGKTHQVVAYAKATGPIDTPVAASEWPEPTPPEGVVYKVPLADVTWLQHPITIDATLRAKLDKFVGKDPNAPWWWFVQTTRELGQADFMLLTGRA
jgi:Type I restriction enzyme R protein N terminus (HSDR_N)